jgi:hypothetical protein
MQESWAMAHWLSRDEPPLFGIEDDAKNFYDLLQWPTGVITRQDALADIPYGAELLHENVRGCHGFVFVAIGQDGRKRIFNYPLSWIPFSTYDLGELPPYALAISYRPPNRRERRSQRITPLPPADGEMVSHVIAAPADRVFLEGMSGSINGKRIEVIYANHIGKLLPRNTLENDVRLVVRRRGEE